MDVENTDGLTVTNTTDTMRTEYGKASVGLLIQTVNAIRVAGKMALSTAEEPFGRTKAL